MNVKEPSKPIIRVIIETLLLTKEGMKKAATEPKKTVFPISRQTFASSASCFWFNLGKVKFIR